MRCTSNDLNGKAADGQNVPTASRLPTPSGAAALHPCSESQPTAPADNVWNLAAAAAGRRGGSDILLRREQVEARVGLKKSAIYALMKDGKFPKCRRVPHTRAVAWRSSDIDAWIDADGAQ
jgi:predicted DNA-binding transcriptional regulator AlpA